LTWKPADLSVDGAAGPDGECALDRAAQGLKRSADGGRSEQAGVDEMHPVLREWGAYSILETKAARSTLERVISKDLLWSVVVGILLGAAGCLAYFVFVGSLQSTSNNLPTGGETSDSTSREKSATTSDARKRKAFGAVSVAIRNFAYDKKNIQVKRGTRVVWTNFDAARHNVMAAHEDDEHAHDAHASRSTGEPNSPLLGTGDSWSFTFDQVGTFIYHCAPHPHMKGSVTVVR
jgi:plastocyanin